MDKNTKKTPRRILRGHKGFSLGETLVALIIVSLLTMSLATGTAFGVRQYRRAVTRSEARILCSTLSAVLADEFSNAISVTTASGGEVTAYNSRRYGSVSLSVKDKDGNTVSESGSGYLYAGDSELLGKAAYSKGYQDLYVKLPEVEYNSTEKRFTVKLTVLDSNEITKIETTFDVIPLNDISV